VAKRLGISDRIVVYYFPTKDDLTTEVIGAVSAQLLGALADAFTEQATDHVALARRAWPVLANTGNDPVFALFFEATGLAAAGQAPYAALVPQLVAAWIDWVAEFIDQGDGEARRQEAEAAVALLDGLLLLRQMVGPEAAERAARGQGII
jgi:AcrR family transcriptional regulator